MSRRHVTLVVLLILGLLTLMISLRNSEETSLLDQLPLLGEVKANVTTEDTNSQVISSGVPPTVSSTIQSPSLTSLTISPTRLPSHSRIPYSSIALPPVVEVPLPDYSPKLGISPKASAVPHSPPTVSPQKFDHIVPTGKPGVSPSKKPSVSPDPFIVYINHTLAGTRPSSLYKINYYDTTVNTPLYLPIPEPEEGYISNMTLQKPAHGNVTLNSTLDYTIKYVPDAWYTGYDTVIYTLVVKTSKGIVQLRGSFQVRVRIGIFLNKPLLKAIPPNYTFSEAGKRTSVIQRVMQTPAFAVNIPDTDLWLPRRYKTCALVGNGGSLLNSSRGIEIDGHELVARLNSSPTDPYARDVGTKVHMSFSSGPQESACWKRNTSLPFYEAVAQLTMPNQWQKYPSCIQRSKGEPILYHALDYLFIDMVDNILNEYFAVYYPHTTERRYRSTGFMATIALMTVCDNISVYGLERGKNMEHHYYPSTSGREWAGHSYKAEKMFFTEVAKGTGIFEKHMYLYDLYRSFKYVVD